MVKSNTIEAVLNSVVFKEENDSLVAVCRVNKQRVMVQNPSPCKILNEMVKDDNIKDQRLTLKAERVIEDKFHEWEEEIEHFYKYEEVKK